MPILQIRDQNGNFIPINAIKGDDGKSAYEQAKEGGYQGTEEEFVQILGSLGGINALQLAELDAETAELLAAHIADKNNPHNVLAEQTGAISKHYPTSSDLNTELTKGDNTVTICCYYGDSLNSPYKEGKTACTHGMVITNAHSDQYGTQLCMPTGEDTLYIRRLNGGGISQWVKLADWEQLNSLISELSLVSAYINNTIVPRLDSVEASIGNTGSYLGTGTTSNQEIAVGGSGSILMITSSNNDIAFVHAYGAHSYPNNASDFSVKQSNAKFENGVLTLTNTSYAGLNANGINYYYKVL